MAGAASNSKPKANILLTDREASLYVAAVADPLARKDLAIVRVAPVENWCEARKAQLRKDPEWADILAGSRLAIIPSTMRMIREGDAEVRQWKVMLSPNPDEDNLWICEHMLELD